MVERGFRPRQKGLDCVVDGCTEWRVSNDLCSKHNMARHRATEKGKAYVKEYNKRYKRPDIKKVCGICGGGFVTARENQELCGECSGSPAGNYKAQERYRKSNIEKVRARDIISKRVKRGTLKKELCIVCGVDAESHHPDYRKPLDVIWLCKEHHSVIHGLDYIFN